MDETIPGSKTYKIFDLIQIIIVIAMAGVMVAMLVGVMMNLRIDTENKAILEENRTLIRQQSNLVESLDACIHELERLESKYVK